MRFDKAYFMFVLIDLAVTVTIIFLGRNFIYKILKPEEVFVPEQDVGITQQKQIVPSDRMNEGLLGD